MRPDASSRLNESSGDSVSWWATTDHIRIAKMHLGGVLAALLLGVQFALVLKAELLTGGGGFVEAGVLGGSLTAHALVLVFLFALPALPLVVGGMVLPPLVGARDLAFPVLNRLTFRLYLAAWLLIALAIIGGSVDSAWRVLPSAADGSMSSTWPLASSAAGLHLLGLALACSALNLLATALYERAEGLRLGELPVLVWGIVSGAAVQLVVSTVLASLGILLFFEHATSASIFAGIAQDPFAYDKLFGFILHAGVAVVLLPAIGVVFEVVATFSRKAPAGGSSNALALGALALLSLGGSGLSLVNDTASLPMLAAHSGIGLLALAPASLLLYNFLATLVGGAVEISAALLHALNFVVLVTIGGLGGLFLATLSTGAFLQGSLFETAQLHFLLGGGSVAGLVTALYYWWPRFMGRATIESRGRLAAGLLFSGYLLAFLPGFVEGARGLSPMAILSGQAMATMAALGGLGAALLILGLLVMCWDLVSSLLGGAEAVANPWGATTLEWLDEPDGAVKTEVIPAYAFSSLRFDPASRSYVSAGSSDPSE